MFIMLAKTSSKGIPENDSVAARIALGLADVRSLNGGFRVALAGSRVGAPCGRRGAIT